MIYIVFGSPGAGKTAFLAHQANMYAFDKDRNIKMRLDIQRKNLMGFHITCPPHCVSANFDLKMKKFGYRTRVNRRINPFRLGFANPYVKTHFNFRYEAIFINEAQKYLNSRMSLYFPPWQSRWYEQHRHLDLDIWLDTQRPMLIDVNIRDLAEFIEIVNLEIRKDKYGQILGLEWLIRKIPDSSMFDRYIASGKKDTDCYTEETVYADYNVFLTYDSQGCHYKFYDGHMYEDIDYFASVDVVESIDGYIKFLQEFDDEMPENYIVKKKV